MTPKTQQDIRLSKQKREINLERGESLLSYMEPSI